MINKNAACPNAILGCSIPIKYSLGFINIEIPRHICPNPRKDAKIVTIHLKNLHLVFEQM